MLDYLQQKVEAIEADGSFSSEEGETTTWPWHTTGGDEHPSSFLPPKRE